MTRTPAPSSRHVQERSQHRGEAVPPTVAAKGIRWVDVAATDVQPLEAGDVDGAIRLIRSTPLHDLRDEAFLREEFLLALGLNGEMLEEFPQGLYPWCGRGILSWQYPVQFAKFLAHLSDRNIRSYVEIGCRHGGTFIIIVEYLRRFTDLYLAAALDIEHSAIVAAYAQRTLGVDYRIANSRNPETIAYLGSHRWDLAFIDGDHRYEGCISDFHAVRENARIVALHDISSDACPGVGQVWQEIRRVMPSRRAFEATDQYADVRARTQKMFLGIGLVDFS